MRGLTIAALLTATVCLMLATVLQSGIGDGRATPKMISEQRKAEHSRGPADIVLTGGKIYTGDPKRPRAGAVAIQGEWIVAVGEGESDLKSWIGPKTRVIDLRGEFAMPGFNDAHVHLASAGFAKLAVNLEGARSLAEFQQRIRERLKDYAEGEWITGFGWDHTLWPGKQFPTRQDLDAISTAHPMIFGRVDGHVAVANSLALKIAQITRTTADPPSGHIVRDPKTSEPTGMLEEDAAMNLVYAHVPPVSAAQRRRALELALDDAAQHGVTSVQDNSVQSLPDDGNVGWDNFLTLQQMRREGKLKVRVTEWLPFDFPLARLEEMRRIGGAGGEANDKAADPWLKMGQLKAFMDGSLGSRTAAMLAPYSDDASTSGILRVDPVKLDAMAIERDRAGFQLAFHAIGDRANRVALDAFAAVRKANGPRDRRDRIEHAQVVAPADFERFAALQVIASMQPSHLLDDERWAGDRIGAERSRGAYAWHTMEQHGVRLAFGTDFPVEAINPLRGLYACVTRELPGGGPTGGWEPQERLPMEQCIQAYTAGAAYAQFEEQRKGTIAPGMLADIVVFPEDITRVRAPDLLKLSVIMTIAGGRIVYQRQ